MKVTVRVPATTANIGPGFDCMGMALPIYNEVTIEETVLPGTGVEINIIDEEQEFDTLSIPTDENNIVYKAVDLLYNSIGQTASELKISIKTHIPIAKGLGSSASVIVGGLIAANELLGRPADEAALLSIATEVEGHPDNIAPAILGGFVLSSQEEDGSVLYRKLPWPKDWKITVCIPDYELATEISRSVLPEKVEIKDAAFNARRCAMLVNALYTEDSELMSAALHDKLHQQYRVKLVPGLKEITDKLKHEDNVLGSVLSGAGPAMIVISKGGSLDKIKEIVSQTWFDLNVKCVIKTLDIEENGAVII
ncbi:MAG: homoserine kinase [Candidatus Gastranaerophilales bacterium]|nr:homoserine kinase [Candidatus Gastranaerophilales bacterium]